MPTRRDEGPTTGAGRRLRHRTPGLLRTSPIRFRSARSLGVVVLVALLAVLAPVPAGAGPTATLTVTVLDRTTGGPVEGMAAWLFAADSAALLGFTATGADGRAVLRVPAGPYRLLVWHGSQPYLPAWFGGSQPGVAPPFQLPAGGTALTVQPFPGGTLRGTVRVDGAPLSGAQVRVFSLIGGSALREAVTGADGSWAASVLPGSYRVEASDANGDFPAVWFGGTLTASASTPVAVTAGTYANVPIDLTNRTAGLVTGTVLADGVPTAGALVSLQDPAGVRADVRLLTDVRGSYLVEVPAGAYVVRAKVVGLAGGWWHDAPDLESATRVNVHTGRFYVASLSLTSPDLTPVNPLRGSVGPAFVAVGDSILQATTTRLSNRLATSHRTSVKGYEGVTILGARPIAERLAALGPDRVLIELGANDLIRTEAPAEQMIADLTTVRDSFPDASCVLVSTVLLAALVGAPGARMTAYNEHIRALPTIDPRVQVVDWDLTVRLAALGSGPRLLGDDNIHPTDAGEDRLAGLVATALTRCPAV